MRGDEIAILAARILCMASMHHPPAMALVAWTDDVDEAFAHLTSAGAPIVQPPHNSGNDNRNAPLRDPVGNLVEIVANVA